MVKKNRTLLTIAGGKGAMMPLYTAALFGHEEVVKYLYKNSSKLGDDGWTPKNRGWLLQKYVENDIFDVALEIMKTYPELDTGSVLGVLARKPEAFPETTINVISRTINWGKNLYSKVFNKHQPSQNGYEVGSESGLTQPFPKPKSYIIERTIKSVFAFINLNEKESNALLLLRLIWHDIAKKPKTETVKY